MLKANHNAASDFSPLAPGQYECFIEAGAVKQTQAGSPMINWKIKVRNDIPGQAGGGRVIFDNLVIQENTMGMVQGFIKALGVPDGHEFDSPDGGATALRDYAVGRPVIANLKIGEWNGNERNEISYYKISQAGGTSPDVAKQSAPQDPFAAGNKPVEVSEDDLPF